MTRPLGWSVCLALAVVLAAAGHGCGNNDNRRDRERCEQCDPAQIDQECVQQCVRFCVPNDPDCTARCNRQCDRCKSELECRQCTNNCTGTVARCAPVDEPLVCQDGTF